MSNNYLPKYSRSRKLVKTSSNPAMATNFTNGAISPKIIPERSLTKSSDLDSIGKSPVFMETVTKKKYNNFNRSCDSIDRWTPGSETHSQFIQPIRKDAPRNLKLFSQQPEKLKRDNSKNSSATSVTKDVKFIGPMLTCKSSTSFNRNFNISMWRSCEILGTPPSRNLKTQTLASVLSCWNYLFSTQGRGMLSALTMETLEDTLLKRDTYDFTVNNSTVNDIIVQWIGNLNSRMDTRSKAFMFYKPVGKNSTNVSRQEALTILQNELNHKNTFLIYHAHDAILIPVGYQILTGSGGGGGKTPQEQFSVVLFSDPCSGHVLSIPWSDVVNDLECQLPYYFDVKTKSQGLLVNSKASSGNSHCIMAFQDDSSSQFTKMGVSNNIKPKTRKI